MLKLLLAGILVVVAVPAAWIGLPVVTERSVIPASCREPADLDFSQVGPTDFGPYSVTFTSWRHVPWGMSSHAVVGHGQDTESRVDDGVHLDIGSTAIDDFRCEWTVEGVTIIEPAEGAAPGNEIEHFVPARRFLGGR